MKVSLHNTNYDDFQLLVALANRRLTRVGSPSITWEVLGHEGDLLSLEVTLPSAGAAGWSYRALLEHHSEGTLVLPLDYTRELPGGPLAWVDAPPHCDHCGTRRGRDRTYLLTRGEQTVQLGSSCLQQYLGDDPAVLAGAALAEILGLFTGSLGALCGCQEEKPGNRQREISLGEYLSWVIRAIALEGYVSARMAREQGGRLMTTAETVAYHLADRKSVPARCLPTGADIEAAAELVKWARAWAEGVTPQDTFQANLRTVIRLGFVPASMTGVAAYLPTLRCRLQTEEQKAGLAKTSHPQGNVGEKIKALQVTILETYRYETVYGPVRAYTMYDQDGNYFRWDCKGAAPAELPVPGDTWLLQGAIKDHRSDGNIPATRLTRARFLKKVT